MTRQQHKRLNVTAFLVAAIVIVIATDQPSGILSHNLSSFLQQSATIEFNADAGAIGRTAPATDAK